MKKFSATSFLIITLIGPISTGTACISSNKMYRLASALTKLSTAVESTVRYKNPPSTITEEELLRISTEHDPALLKRFDNYAVHVLSEDKHAVILVCSKNQAQGLLEDAGCSAVMDVHLWKTKPPLPCKFTLNVAEACETR